MGRYTKIPENAFEGLQVDAGVLLKRFDIEEAAAGNVGFTDADIICATTGGINPSCVPTYSDYAEDVDNAPNNVKEFKHLDSWECKISTTSLGNSPELIRLSLGAADIDITNTGKIVPRRSLKQTDFTDIWWVGDRADGGFVAIQLLNALSTGGFSLQTTKNGKGQVSLEISGHVSIASQDVIPMQFYSIDPAMFDAVKVEPESPATELYGAQVSEMQTGVEVTDDAITGTLHFIEGGLADSGPLAGDGNFLALKYSNIDEDATSVKIGLEPSYGTGMVELMGDPDMNSVCKIHDTTQKFKVVQTNGVKTRTQVYSLSGLTLETE